MVLLVSLLSVAVFPVNMYLLLGSSLFVGSWTEGLSVLASDRTVCYCSLSVLLSLFLVCLFVF